MTCKGLRWRAWMALWFGAAAAGCAGASAAGVEVALEGQVAWQQRNDVQSPNDASGSRFALDAITGDGPALAPRLSLRWPLRGGESRHELAALIAPLRIDGSGRTATALGFEGASFAPGPIRADYRFDSWRVGWRWRWIERPDLVVRVGATAKIRDAQISLVQGALRARKTNTGFVPLLHVSAERPAVSGWSWAVEFDGLAGGPGYAVDAAALLRYDLSERWRVQGGLRFLDGGADNDEVYAFARFTGVTLGVAHRFR